MDGSLEIVQARPLWEVTLRRKANGVNEISCSCGSSVFGLDDPFSGWLVELSAHDFCVEGYVFFDVQDVLDVVEVLAELLEARVLF